MSESGLHIKPEERMKENLYLAHKSVKEEIPRLVRQARLLFGASKPMLTQVFQGLPPGRMLDCGSGTGMYLSLIAKLLPEHDIHGLDISPKMIEYARLCFPEFNFTESTIYDIPFKDNYFDLLHASFVFIHLREPEAALKEIRRVLKPNGTLVIFDIDDSTFQGPVEILNLVKRYNEIYEGDRAIMSSLPEIAEKERFTLEQDYIITVDNTGGDDTISHDDDGFHIGRMTFWGLLSFMGQRDEVKHEYEVAQSYYMGNLCEVEASVKGHVYRSTGE